MKYRVLTDRGLVYPALKLKKEGMSSGSISCEN
jgi:hypothetical protein